MAAFYSGALADRHDRGTLMRLVNLIGLVAIAGLAAVFVLPPGGQIHLPGPPGFYLPTWILFVYPLWAAVIVSSTIFRPAFNTSVPRVVRREFLGRANGAIYAIAGGVSAAGTIGVGILLTVAPAAYAFAVPFALFFVTQAALRGVDVDLSVTRTGPTRSLLRDARNGFTYLGRHRAILQITVAGLVINFLVALATVELALYVTTWLGLTQGIWYGAMVAAATVGASVGFVLVANVRFEPWAGRALIGLTCALGLTLFALALVHTIWLALPIIFLFGTIPGMFTTIFLSTIQSTVPDEMMGRVFSADEVGSYALVPVGQYAGGELTVAAGVEGTYLFAGATILVFGVFMFAAFGALRNLSYPGSSAAPTS
ncbi:MAG: MFS transporter [Thermoplasmata archaeon]|nr:MFS transporter [Thermoplasmata archaeon]